MEEMSRKEKLLKLFEGAEGGPDVVKPMIDDVVFLESRLSELRALPFIEISERNRAHQRPTAAAKQYKELLQQYNNCLKILTSVLRKDTAEEESPLREWVRKNAMDS